jgi:hypothetical protein
LFSQSQKCSAKILLRKNKNFASFVLRNVVLEISGKDKKQECLPPFEPNFDLIFY